MKTLRKNFLIVFFIVLHISGMNAQKKAEGDPIKESKLNPQPVEKVIGTVTTELDGGKQYQEYEWNKDSKRYRFVRLVAQRKNPTEAECLDALMSKAKNKYGEEYPKFSLRNFTYNINEEYLGDFTNEIRDRTYYKYKLSAQVVIIDPKEAAIANIASIIEKAMKNVPKGSRVSIDQIKVTTNVNEDDYKDNLIEKLLDKGYKVIAKEFMQKLYEEQKQQQTGVYNEETTVQKNNFSAVGYYVNIKMTEEALRMQVVNVSTGEYEGNAVINF